MNSNNTNRSTSQLQSDVRAEINQIKQSLENIKNRASPGQLIDDAIFYPHQGNPARTFDHLKRNPVGTTFLAVGTILLMEDSQQRTVESRVGMKVSDARTRMSGAVGEMRESLHHVADSARSTVSSVKGTVSSVKGKVSSTVDGLKSRVKGSSDSDIDSNMSTDQASFDNAGMNDRLYVDSLGTGTASEGRFDDVKDTLSGAMENVSDRASQIKTSIGTSTHNFSGRVKETIGTSVDSIRDRVNNMDPITYIALGAGLGALSGAALPVSEAEQRLVDSNLGDGLAVFKTELQAAFHQSFDVMKTEFVSGLTDFDFGKLKDTFSNSSSV